VSFISYLKALSGYQGWILFCEGPNLKMGGKNRMKKVIVILMVLLMISGCTGGQGGGNGGGGGNGQTGEYDYLLSDYGEDVIIPTSGTAENWITIIGGNQTGQYYVSPDGSDSNPGTIDQPFRTIAYGVSQLQAGDTLVIFAKDKSKTPVIAGENNLFAAFDISGCKYLRIENLEITSNNGAQFREAITGTGGPVEHIILKDLHIHHMDEFGIDIGDVNDLQIIDCDMTYCGFGCIGGPAGEHGGWRNVLIQGCNLSYSGHYYQGGDGSDRPYDRPDGFGIEASEGPIEICATTAAHNYGDGLDSKAKRTYIHECIVANNSCDGVKLWGDQSRVVNTLIYGRGDGDSTETPWSPFVISTETNASFEINSCTVDDIVGNNYIMHVQYDFPTTPVNLKIVNTIFCSRGTNAPIIWLADAVNYDITYNLFYSPNDGRLLIQGDTTTYSSDEVTQIGQGNIYGNPLFNAVAWGTIGDYHLGASSPAINAGDSSSAPSIDLDNITRPQGDNVDIGCYEQ